MQAPIAPAAPDRWSSFAVVLAWIEAGLAALITLIVFASLVSLRSTDSLFITLTAMAAVSAVILGWGAARISKPEWRTEEATGPVAWHGIAVALSMAGGFVGGNVLSGIGGGVLAVAAGAHPTAVATALSAVVVQVLLYAGLAGNAYVFALARWHTTLRDLGWRMPRRMGPLPGWLSLLLWLAAAVVLAAATVIAASLLVSLAQSVAPGATNPQCQAIQSDYGRAAALAIVVVSVAAPIVEETMFRGFLYKYCERRWNVAAGIAVSAAVFALFHGVPLLLPALFLVGAVLAAMYRLSDSLYPGMVIHSLFNLWGVIGLLSGSC